IEKQAPGLVLLSSNVVLSHELNLISGDLALDGYLLNLGSTGVLVQEKESSRVKDPSGLGSIIALATLNGPNQANPGNLGLEITSSANLGSVAIRRFHDSPNLSGTPGIQRRYLSTAANNANLNATLVFNYLEAELNGISETDFEFYRSDDGGLTWNAQATSVHNPGNNQVSLSGVGSISQWATTQANVPFPVEWLSISARWERMGSQVGALVEWGTAIEQQSDYFLVERQVLDSRTWQVVGKVDAAGNSQGTRVYQLFDEQIDPLRQLQYAYRIREIDLNGQSSLSEVALLEGQADLTRTLAIHPNPAQSETKVYWSLAPGERAQEIRIHDLLGQELDRVPVSGIPNDEYVLRTRSLPRGSYLIMLMTNEGFLTQKLRVDH
ncbi:MAG: T9SS type A sorting domain-containing protein, partial [Bacteroidota bacterium]